MDTLNISESRKVQRIKITVHGAVQGVGFRPFVYRLATRLGLHGGVANAGHGVRIEAEGPAEKLEAFLVYLQKDHPPYAVIQSIETSTLDTMGYAGFKIFESPEEGEKSAWVSPDIASCSDCVAEIFDPKNRRYYYPFTNCAHCGPRYSIVESIPYDRPNTTMKNFKMCPACLSEYENPSDRRYHAQANACPVCGPKLTWVDKNAVSLTQGTDALFEAAKALGRGQIVALKGLGGFQLLVDATNDEAVLRLRERKHREEKPFALMMPSLEAARDYCEISPPEERLLRSAQAPIVLLPRKLGAMPNTGAVAPSAAPHHPMLGLMLPYTPLHHLLMKEFGRPVIATSGNLGEEPIVIENADVFGRLSGIADFFLIHDRPIARHVDDSVARIILGRELVLRRARGYAPLPLVIGQNAFSVLAVGAHLKNTIAQVCGNNIFISQHIGDLETEKSFQAFRDTIRTFERFYGQKPRVVACDLHPDYMSKQYAASLGLPLIRIQHHRAHVFSCMAENEIAGNVLGVAWDGTGYGDDGSLWGGEFFLTDKKAMPRLTSFRPFRLPGNEKAVQEPRRSALGVLYEIYGEELFEPEFSGLLKNFSGEELRLLKQMLRRGTQSHWTSSAGRLFDAVSSILDIRQALRYEGQAAMELEFTIGDCRTDDLYEIGWKEVKRLKKIRAFDWEPMIRHILSDREAGVPAAFISARFHNTLAEVIVQVAKDAKEKKVVLTGGCFQNRYLLERAVQRLEQEGFSPYWHQRIPPNDGGIALGQAMAALRVIKYKRKKK